MMNKERSHRWACLKYLFVLPLSALVVVAFAQPPIDELKYSFLNDKGLSTTVEMKRKGHFTSSMKDSILVVVNEKVKGYGEEVLSSIPGEQIESILTVHSNDAVAEYGDKAKHGAIKITTKEEDEESTPVKEKLIFQVVEEMPEFPGGMKECMKFISQNAQYPVEAHQDGIHGKVWVSCVISDKGDIESPHIYRSVDPLLDAEALRVIKSMPKWKPGKQRGKPVNVMFMFPVAFNLQ
jgi:TonB family protein